MAASRSAPSAAPADFAHARDALAALAAALLPFFFALPPWIAGSALALVAWRALVLGRRLRLPPAPLRLVLVVAALGGVVATFRGFGGAEAGSAFLVLTAALKGLESRSRRDFRVLTVIAFLLVATAFLLTQSLPLGLYGAAVIWLCALAALRAGAPQRRAWPLARRAGSLLLAALPTAAVLFLLFPRLPGPLFRFGAPRFAAITGLSDRLEPGSIAELAVDDSVAFRVHFAGPLPPPGVRYFRGPTFTTYDGRRWLPHGSRDATGHFTPRGGAVSYRVLERSSGTRYLFALALPTQVSTPSRLGADFALRAPHPIWNEVAFTAISYTRYVAQPALPASERTADLALPPGADPRTRALAARWRRTAGSPEAVVRRALAWIHDQPFYYTLTPPRLHGINRVDEFLFGTRRGFCEHYASAFAVLMRAAGIPARVVTGYAGGTINPYDGWLVVRQSDAHAWDEVWLAARGWVRVDPTAEIPPARIETSARSLAPSDVLSVAAGSGLFARLRDAWDAADTLWTQYLVGYGPELQRRLLGQLGLARAAPILVALIMIGAAALAGLAALVRVPLGAGRPDPARRAYERWCRRLARHGLRRAPHEAPLAFLRRIGERKPELYAEAAAVTALYVRARYAGDAAALTALRRRLRASPPERDARGPRAGATGRRAR